MDPTLDEMVTATTEGRERGSTGIEEHIKLLAKESRRLDCRRSSRVTSEEV